MGPLLSGRKVGLFPVPARPRILSFVCAVLAMLPSAFAAIHPDLVGLAPLRGEQPTLTGTGVPVGMSEGTEPGGGWEVNPGDSRVLQPVSLFTWISQSGTSTSYPNAVGSESSHAGGVGSAFFGSAVGVAPGVQHVRNYDVNYYYPFIIGMKTGQADVIVNQSWAIPPNVAMQTAYDTYAVQYNVLFVSGMDNNTGTPPTPGSCYNGIGVGRATLGTSSVGPTADGRCKPDIVVAENDGSPVSFLTPAVSGAAALLWQAAARNDGGPGTAVIATNASVIKALLLNGAVKQSFWTNGPTRPLDARMGAGALNIYNSWRQLSAGRTTVGATNFVGRGWDYTNITSSANNQTNRYFVQLTNGAAFSGVVTLVWKADFNILPHATNLLLANFDLFLVDSNAQVLASSVSLVDNVEHLFLTNVPPGRYEIRVVRRGGVTGPGNHALAFDFASSSLNITRAASAVTVSWPVNEAGFALQYSPSVNPPITWQTIFNFPLTTNGCNTLTFPPSGEIGSFRLYRP